MISSSSNLMKQDKARRVVNAKHKGKRAKRAFKVVF